MDQLLELVRPETAGDPMGGLFWTRRSLVKLAEALTDQGVKVSSTTVGKWLRALGYSLRVNRKRLSSSVPPDRDDQFKYIAALRAYCREMGIPLISVDTKKKELIGLFANAGAVWSNAPKLVNDHDFPSLAKAKAIPYGVYDLTFNHGLICLGDSSDTAEFAVENIVRWVQNFGRVRSPGADRLVILADCGGSNGNRSRAWKYFLQTFLSDVFQIQVTVAHYPAGASKWNPIEHLLFSAISRNWAGRPLECWKTILNYIRTTTNKSGLEVEAVRVTKQYETGIRISKEQMDQVNLIYNEFLPKWNYTIHPRNSTPDDIPTLEACLTELKKKNETLIPVTQ